ncbi:Ankrd52 [Symbiodinium pilosum]|uniref:Ankrd52 protein n=1 Tax=Symbiodinium pilosum TaxID=2952 RepID=A0A812UU78_SYMPI|nr:Ankrd52 [Symbiodinium pilosum]
MRWAFAVAVVLTFAAEARKKASPEEEALQELDVDKSGKVEQNELESFARSKGMTPDQIHQEFLSLDLNGDGVLEADEIRRTLQASAAADATPSAPSASLGQAAAPAESALQPPKVPNVITIPRSAAVDIHQDLQPEKLTEEAMRQAPAAPASEEGLDVRAEHSAERAVAELFEKKAADALASMREDLANAEKLELSARALRGQAKELETQVNSQVAQAAKAATDSIVQKALRQVKLMSQEVASAEEQAKRHQNLADEAMEQAVSAQSKISEEVRRIKADHVSPMGA